MILVAGGAGYIGSHAVKALKKADLRPVIFDNVSSGHRSFVKDTPWVEGDIRSPADIARALDAYPIEGVLHFAGRALVEESRKNPGLYYDTNVTGGVSLLEAMRQRWIRCLIFSSSWAT